MAIKFVPSDIRTSARTTYKALKSGDDVAPLLAGMTKEQWAERSAAKGSVGTPILVRCQPVLLAKIDAYCEAHGGITRPEAVRRMIDDRNE